MTQILALFLQMFLVLYHYILIQFSYLTNYLSKYSLYSYLNLKMYILSDFQYLRQLHHTMLRPHKLRYELLHYNLSDTRIYIYIVFLLR